MTKITIKVSNHDLDDVDIREIAKLTLAARKVSTSEEMPTVETVSHQLLNKLDHCSPREILLARSNEKVVGWLSFYDCDHGTSFAHIWNWHPIVSPGNNENEIAGKLIEKSISYARKSRKSRLIIDFPIKKDDHTDSYRKYSQWYGKFGVNELETTALMKCNLLSRNYRYVRFPRGFRLTFLAEADDEELYGCRYETYMASEDRVFLELTAKERLETFNQMIGDHENLNKEASLVLMKGNDIAGFSIINALNSEEGYLRSFGIHPDHRRKKLGKNLLLASMKALTKQGFATMSLDVDCNNKPACELYRSMGFETVTLVIGHSLQLGDN